MTVQTPAPAPPNLPDPNLIASQVQETVMFILGMIVVLIVAVKVLGPVARALGRRLEGRVGDPELRAEVQELHERIAAVEQNQLRVADLEDRLDFAERMLVRAPAEQKDLHP